jgi:hypothetical protein
VAQHALELRQSVLCTLRGDAAMPDIRQVTEAEQKQLDILTADQKSLLLQLLGEDRNPPPQSEVITARTATRFS